jgi:hypothetical protein
MGPAVFLDRSIHRRVRRLARDLLVFAGILKLKIVLQIIAGHLSRRLAKDCETRKFFGVVLAREIEGQQGLLVTNISFHGKGVLARCYERHGDDLIKSGLVLAAR